MTEDEKKLNDVDKRVSNLETTFNMFMQEMRDFKTELRDRDNRRAAEIAELRQKQDAAQAKHDADMKELQKSFYAKMDNMDAKIDSINKHVQNLTVAAIVGIGAAVIGIGAVAVTVIYSVLTR